MKMASGQPSAACDSAAMRRRQRRLRHERMTVAMALAEKVHHSAQPIPHEDRRMSGPASGARDELYGDDPGPPSSILPSLARALQPLRRRGRRDAAGQDSYLVRAAGGTAAGNHAFLRHAHA